MSSNLLAMFKKGDVALPSSPTDRAKIKEMLNEMVSNLRKMDDCREDNREIAKEIKRLFEIPPKQSNRLAKTLHKHDFLDQDADHSAFVEMYEQLVERDDSI